MASEIDDTKSKLEALKQADKQAKAQLESGNLGQDKYEALQREIVATEKSLESLQEKASKTSNIGASLTKFGDAASSASEKTKGLSTAAGGLLGAMAAAVPASEELRTDLSKLDSNARDAGVGIDKTRTAFEAFNVVSDEVDSSVEATSNLLQAGFTESNLQKAVEGLSGAYLRFPDTLKIESLADSLQETLATGQATGQFGELLDRLGIGAENFSNELSGLTTEAEKQNYALETLANAGLMDTYSGWLDSNSALVESKQATQEFNEAVAGLAETITPIVTKVTEFATAIITAFNSLPASAQNAIIVMLGLVAALSPVLGIAGKLSTIMGSGGLTGVLAGAKAALAAVSGAIAGISAPVLIVVAAIGALIAIFATLWKTNEDFRNNISEVWSNIQSAIGNAIESIKGIFQAFVDLVNVLWNLFGDTIMSVVSNTINHISTAIENGLNIIENIIKLFTSVLKGDWSGAWEAVKNILSSVLNILFSFVKSTFNSIVSVVKGFGGSIGSAVSSAFQSGISFITSLPGKAIGWGRDFINGLARGIRNAISAVTSAVKSVASKITSFLHFSRPDEGPLHYYEEWMPDFMKGLSRGITDNLWRVKDAVGSVSKAISTDISASPEIAMASSPSVNVNNAVTVQVGNEQLKGYIVKTATSGITNAQKSYMKSKGGGFKV